MNTSTAPTERGGSGRIRAGWSGYGVQSGDGAVTISSDEMRIRLTDDVTTFFEGI